jgi:hypothetical protein
MTATDEFIQRKKVESPHSRTLRMLELAEDLLHQIDQSEDWRLAHTAFDVLDRIASEPPNAPQAQGD